MNLEPQKLDHDWIRHCLCLVQLQWQCPRSEKEPYISLKNIILLAYSFKGTVYVDILYFSLNWWRYKTIHGPSA
jgi:hypothetical protein